MDEFFVKSLEDFKENNINECIKFKQELMTLKNNFDLSNHNYNQFKLKHEKDDNNKIKDKINELENKKINDEKILLNNQNTFINLVENMNKYKNNELLKNMEATWDCYLHFSGMLLQTIWQNTNNVNQFNNKHKKKLLNNINDAYVYAEVKD